MSRHYQEYRHNHAARRMARGLGWFSIGLGVAQLLMPRPFARVLGMPEQEGLMRLYGLREIGTGVGLLLSDNPEPWIYGRIAGDALDLTTLGVGMQQGDNPAGAAVAAGAVLGITTLDVACARGLAEEHHPVTVYDYSDRSGFPKPAEQMRGLVISDGRMDSIPQITGMDAADRETEVRH
ncbi:transcriptional regulator [Stutzerimonas nosocomialis]|uniref:transcriptional regulator n=1 Tax=Stutzerimonas nosocomialis TaxID=1056496 RepID=UPI001F50361F|nr:transcriptional regulator [Stutzerimonas nosocomialis]